MVIERAHLKALCDYEAEAANVRAAFNAASTDPVRLVRFLSYYTSWNSLFGSGVSSLAGKIGRSRALFREPGLPHAVADRSVLVASYFFDAARDEFDDRDTEHRDTHRCLAQATLIGALGWARTQSKAKELDDASLDAFLAEPMWLAALRHRVTVGYGGGTPDEASTVFRSIGYHLGSELLADQEFSQLDLCLRERCPGLVEHLEGNQVTIAGQAHDAYQWIGIHSGHGGGAEADHFDWALQGALRAFEFVDPADHTELRHQIEDGYVDFARDHREFFERSAG
ncbi:MAG: hypothetical protein AB7S26_01155 [Sandaracinaceae bacterium]